MNEAAKYILACAKGDSLRIVRRTRWRTETAALKLMRMFEDDTAMRKDNAPAYLGWSKPLDR